jgi:hypothetical protein
VRQAVGFLTLENSIPPLLLSMAPPTTEQIIAEGTYLLPNFKPTSLNTDQLRGLLIRHGIPYPQPGTKAEFVKAFNTHIKRQAELFQAERDNAVASSAGIVDGVTGEPIVD